jgi:molybdopterin synthase sulfur carrier subunit
MQAGRMKIRVTGYLTLRGTVGRERLVEVETERVTLKDFVKRLSLELGDGVAPPVSDAGAFVGPSRRIIILVNGRHSSHLPDGLDTELVDGDEVSLFPPVAGG